MKQQSSTLVAMAALGAAALVVVPGTATAASSADSDPPSARAAVTGSIVFVRDHDVFVARADGSGARPVTTDGTAGAPYRSPSQASDGTIAATRGAVIVRMTPQGRVLNTLDPPPISDSTGFDLKTNPTDVAISPDGRHIAYTYAYNGCPVGLPCGYRSVTGFTESQRLTDPARYGESYYDAPAWLSNSRTVQGGGGGVTVNLQDLGSDPVRWFSDYDTDAAEAEDLYDPAVSTAAGLYAAVRGYDESTHIAWYALRGDPTSGPAPAAPSIRCATSADESLGSPTFSADGEVLAWQEGDDVWATSDPSDCGHQPQVWLDDASAPAFSPATYVDAAPDAPAATAAPSVGGTPAVGRTLKARRGTWTGATSYAYAWLRNGAVVRGATGSSYRVTRADAGRRLAVRVTATGPGGRTTATSAAVRVPRR